MPAATGPLVVAVSRADGLGGRVEGLVDAAAPVVTADDLGLTRGDGCFEGLRLVRAPSGAAEVPNLEAHLARMQRSARSLDLPDDPPPGRTCSTSPPAPGRSSAAPATRPPSSSP